MTEEELAHLLEGEGVLRRTKELAAAG